VQSGEKYFEALFQQFACFFASISDSTTAKSHHQFPLISGTRAEKSEKDI